MSIPQESADAMVRIWLQSEGGTPYFSRMYRMSGLWTEMVVPEGLDLTTVEQTDGDDIFFSVRTFDGKRTNANATPARLLFADLDGVHPATLGNLEPSLWWSTTPMTNYQGVWFTDEPVEAGLNKRLTYKVGADKGGWHASKMLRVPLSINFKRGRVINTEIDGTGIVLDTNWLRALLEDAPTGFDTISFPTPEDHPDPPEDKDREWLLRLYWPEMSLMARSWLVKSKPGDRSMHIVKLTKELFACGFNANEIFLLLHGADFNKYRHRPQALWNEINKFRHLHRPR